MVGSTQVGGSGSVYEQNEIEHGIQGFMDLEYEGPTAGLYRLTFELTERSCIPERSGEIPHRVSRSEVYVAVQGGWAAVHAKSRQLLQLFSEWENADASDGDGMEKRLKLKSAEHITDHCVLAEAKDGKQAAIVDSVELAEIIRGHHSECDFIEAADGVLDYGMGSEADRDRIRRTTLAAAKKIGQDVFLAKGAEYQFLFIGPEKRAKLIVQAICRTYEADLCPVCDLPDVENGVCQSCPGVQLDLEGGGPDSVNV